MRAITAQKKHTQSLHCSSFVLHSDATILIFCCWNFQIKQKYGKSSQHHSHHYFFKSIIATEVKMIEEDKKSPELHGPRAPFNAQDLAVIEKFIKEHFDKNYDRLFPTVGKRSRQSSERPNYWESTLGESARIVHVKSGVSKKFRRRFRVPYRLFKEVIDHGRFEYRVCQSIIWSGGISNDL